MNIHALTKLLNQTYIVPAHSVASHVLGAPVPLLSFPVLPVDV